MKFVQASKAYAPHVGGIETVVRQLAEGMADRGHESSVIVCGNEPTPAGGSVQVSRARSFGTFRSIPLSPGYGFDLMNANGDVLLIHLPSALPELIAGIGWRRLRRRFDKIVVWWHSDILRQKLMARVYTPVVRELLDQVDAIIVATPHHVTSSPVLPEYESKIHVIPYGVDLARFEGTGPTTLLTPSDRGGDRLALFVGRLVYYKGIEELLAAFEQVTGCTLAIVGDGPLLKSVERAQEQSPSKVVRFPPLPEADMVGLLQASDFFVFPSIETSEAFGISQVEAMACGKPVITFDLPSGVTWVNRHLETGLVVKLRDTDALADAIQQFVDDSSLTGRLGRGARRRVEAELSESVMLDRVEHLLFGDAHVGDLAHAAGR